MSHPNLWCDTLRVHMTNSLILGKNSVACKFCIVSNSKVCKVESINDISYVTLSSSYVRRCKQMLQRRL